MITWYSFINQSKAYVDRFSPKVIVCLEHFLRCSLCSSLCFWIWNPKILYTEMMAWNAKGPRFESWLRLNWLFITDLWLTFHRRLRLAPNSQNPWLFLRNMPHSIYRILATIIVKIYLSFPKITVTFIHDSRYAMNRIFWSAQLDARIILPLFQILVLINRNI